MKHLFKVETSDEGVIITLALKLSLREVASIMNTSNDSNCATPKDLVKGYKTHGLEWLLHLLRLYISFGKFPTTIKTQKKKRRKNK